jgi:uncharacterized protein YbaP (TraB family)
MMKRYAASLITVLVIILTLAACSAKDKPFVWEITKDGNTLYLGGSIHVLRVLDFPLPDEYERAFALSSRLVLEANIEELENEEMKQYTISQMFLPDGKRIQSILDNETYNLLTEKCLKYGLDMGVIDVFKPTMVWMLLLANQIIELEITEKGVDSYFQRKANAKKMPASFLEDAKWGVDFLMNLGEDDPNNWVQYFLRDIEETEEYFIPLMEEWKKGDSRLMDISLKQLKEYPEIYKALIADRNAAWMPQIEAFLASGETAFVVVGTLHMLGEDSLLAQLKKSGCTIKKLK